MEQQALERMDGYSRRARSGSGVAEKDDDGSSDYSSKRPSNER